MVMFLIIPLKLYLDPGSVVAFFPKCCVYQTDVGAGSHIKAYFKHLQPDVITKARRIGPFLPQDSSLGLKSLLRITLSVTS